MNCAPAEVSLTHRSSRGKPARRYLRRFTVISSGLLTVLLATLSVSFAANTGSTAANLTTTNATGVVVHTVGPDAGPVEATTLPYGSHAPGENVNWSAAIVPSWSVALGAAGTVPADGAGDLAYIDATASQTDLMTLRLHVTNLAELAGSYSSYNFNITLYQSADGRSGWRAVEPKVLTSDQGALTWTIALDTDVNERHYAISLDAGGAFYTVSTRASRNLSPAFYVST